MCDVCADTGLADNPLRKETVVPCAWCNRGRGMLMRLEIMEEGERYRTHMKGQKVTFDFDMDEDRV